MSHDHRPDEDDEGRDSSEPGPEDTGVWPAITDADLESPGPVDTPSQEAAGPATLTDEEAPGSPAVESFTTTASGDYGPRLLASLSQMNQLLEERLGALETLFDREVRAEATRERIVDRLHAELQEYKQDLLLKVQRPIFIDLIQLHDDLGKLLDVPQPEDRQDPAALRGVLDSVRTSIEDILYRQGVEPFRTEGLDFDPRRQRAVSTVPTDEPAQNKTIAGRLRPGFQAGEKLIRPEIVSVFTLRK